MAALVGEMQLSLKQAEKALDEHFRDPSNTTILGPVDGVFGQIGGALAILDQDVVPEAVNYTRGLVKEFSEGSEDKDPPALARSIRWRKTLARFHSLLRPCRSQPELAKNALASMPQLVFSRPNCSRKHLRKNCCLALSWNVVLLWSQQPSKI